MRKNRGLGLVLSYLNTILNMISGLVLSSFLLLSLGDTEYGLYQTVSSFAGYLALLEFGTGTVMTRNISVCLNSTSLKDREEAVNRNLSTVWMISLVLSALMAVGASIFYMNLGNIYAKTMNAEQIAYAKNIMLFMFGYILLGYLNQNTNGFLLAHEEYTFASLLSVIRVILKTVSLIILISIWQHAIIIAAVEMTLSLVVFILTLVYSIAKYHARISPRYFDKRIFFASIPMCLALLLQTLTNQANSSVDKFVIGVTMSMESVALYSVAQYVFSMFATVATIPVSMFLPEVSKNMAKKLSPKEFTDTLIHPCRLTTLICGSLLCGFFAVGKQFICLLYSPEKKEAWLYALIIITPMFVNMTDAVIINVLDVANKRLVRSLALLGTTVANIILTVWFIDLWGIIGAVIATAITLVIGNILVVNIYYFKKFKIRILYLYKEAYKGILPFQLISGITAYFTASFIRSDLLSLLIGGLMYILLSFSLIFFFGLRKEEKVKLNTFLRKIKVKK